MASSTIIQPKRSFSTTGADGNPLVFRQGETFHRQSTRLAGLSEKQITEHFEPFRPDHDIEQATAAPGEKRGKPPKKGS